MIRRILALSGIGVAVVFAQGGGGRGGAPPVVDDPNPKLRQLFAYDVTVDPKFTVPKTPWGEPDLQGIWPIDHLIAVPLVRPPQYGDRLYRNDQEFAAM